MASTKGKTICITSLKGGVGKTIFSLLLSASFQKLGKKVLLVDLDFYNGGLSLALNLNAEKTIYNFTDDLMNNRYEDFHDYVTTYREGLDVLSSPIDPRQAMKIDEKYVELILNNAIYRYDVILLDTTHILDKLNITMLDESDIILYVLSNDMLHLKGAKTLMAILEDIEKTNVKVVLNTSLAPDRQYYSIYDMKNIIHHNIDYTLARGLFFRNIDSILMDGTLLSTFEKMPREVDKLVGMAKELVGEGEKTNG